MVRCGSVLLRPDIRTSVYVVVLRLLPTVLLQLRDLLAIEVNDPAGFSARLEEDKADALHPIHPIPLQPSVIADCLKDDVWLMIAQFPWEEIDKDNDHRAECLEIACGLKRIVNVHQGKPILVIQLGPAVTACTLLVIAYTSCDKVFVEWKCNHVRIE